MDKLSESKKESMAKEKTTVLEDEKIKFQEMVIEFNKTMDAQLKKLKESKDEFENTSAVRKHELDDKQKELDNLAKRIERDRATLTDLEKKYTEGIEANKERAKDLDVQYEQLKTDMRKSADIESRLDAREALIERNEKRIENKKKLVQEEIERTDSLKLALIDKEKQIDEILSNKESEFKEMVRLKALYSQKLAIHVENVNLLKKQQEECDDAKRFITALMNDLNQRETEIKRKEEDSLIKENILDKREKELTENLQKFEELRKDVEKSIAESIKLKNEADESVSIAKELNIKAESETKENSEERERLNDWSKRLTEQELTLKDKARLVDIEEKRVKEKLKRVEEIRREINKEEK